MAETSSLTQGKVPEGVQPDLGTAFHQQSNPIGAVTNDSEAGDPCHAMKSAGLKEDNVPGAGCSERHMQNKVKAIGQGMKAACLQWEQVMVESEQFELLCPTRVEKLLQEAKAMEARLLYQKEQLINRLKKLSQTLQVLS